MGNLCQNQVSNACNQLYVDARFRSDGDLIVDDGSMDYSREDVNDHAERGVTLVALGRNTGEYAGMNACTNDA